MKKKITANFKRKKSY